MSNSVNLFELIIIGLAIISQR